MGIRVTEPAIPINPPPSPVTAPRPPSDGFAAALQRGRAAQSSATPSTTTTTTTTTTTATATPAASPSTPGATSAGAPPHNTDGTRVVPGVTPASAAPSTPAPGLGAATTRLLARVSQGERYIESIVHRAMRGAAFSPADLLVMQARVYRYAQDLELVSKLADRATSGVRTILQQNG